MKKMSAVIASLCVLSAAAAMAVDPVYSVNAVGYESVAVETGKMALLRMDFFGVNQATTVSNLFGRSLPLGTKAYFWNGVGYDIEEYKRYYTSGNWATNWRPGTYTVDVAEAFWVKIPTGGVQSSYSVTMSGEVPGGSTLPSNTVSIGVGLNMVGYSYPASIAWTNTALSKVAVVNDKLYLWNGIGYDIYTYSRKYTSGAWVTNWGVGTNVVLSPGQGFWYSRITNAPAYDWTENKPYNWP